MHKNEESKIPITEICICSVIASGLFFVLLLVFSAVILKSSSDGVGYLLYGLASGVLSAFINGFVALRLIKEKGLLYGAVCGLIQSILCAVVLFIINKGTAGNGVFILMGIIILVSSLGGLASVNLKRKVKY